MKEFKETSQEIVKQGEEMIKRSDIALKFLLTQRDNAVVIAERISGCEDKMEAFISGFRTGFAACLKEVRAGRLTPAIKPWQQ